MMSAKPGHPPSPGPGVRLNGALRTPQKPRHCLARPHQLPGCPEPPLPCAAQLCTQPVPAQAGQRPRHPGGAPLPEPANVWESHGQPGEQGGPWKSLCCPAGWAVCCEHSSSPFGAPSFRGAPLPPTLLCPPLQPRGADLGSPELSGLAVRGWSWGRGTAWAGFGQKRVGGAGEEVQRVG